MNKIAFGIGIALATLALGACETTGAGGTGAGNVRGSQKPVAFTWQSEDSNSGDITATFGNGRVFKGKYYQITDSAHAEHLDPLWEGWTRPSHSDSWRYWSDEDKREFVREYDGRVLANLRANDGEHMRCRFTLASPTRGMSGGGEGRCQLSQSSREVNAEFPSQS
jgi:hypothetical protein